jgi:hypothetical protein
MGVILAGLDRPIVYWPYRDRTAGSPESGQEQERACPDQYWLDGEGGAQSEVVGEAAEKVGGGDDEHTAEQLGAGVGGVAVSGGRGQGEGQ